MIKVQILPDATLKKKLCGIGSSWDRSQQKVHIVFKFCHYPFRIGPW